MVNDTISDFLARIKNGYLARKSTVSVPYAKALEKIGELMVESNYLENMEVISQKKDKKTIKKEILLTLKYEGKKPVLQEIVRVSKPGKRVYIKSGRIRPTLSGFGISIISTPKGLMTGKEARKIKLGGEFICQIW